MNQMGQIRLILILFWGPESALPNVQHKAFRKRKKVLCFLRKCTRLFLAQVQKTGFNPIVGQCHPVLIILLPDLYFMILDLKQN